MKSKVEANFFIYQNESNYIVVAHNPKLTKLHNVLRTLHLLSSTSNNTHCFLICTHSSYICFEPLLRTSLVCVHLYQTNVHTVCRQCSNAFVFLLFLSHEITTSRQVNWKGRAKNKTWQNIRTVPLSIVFSIMAARRCCCCIFPIYCTSHFQKHSHQIDANQIIYIFPVVAWN